MWGKGRVPRKVKKRLKGLKKEVKQNPGIVEDPATKIRKLVERSEERYPPRYRKK